MASTGPLPKRDAERRRQNKPEVPTDTVRMVGTVHAPPCPAHLHPLARAWYKSLGESGQSRYYEPSDWATARIWATLLSEQLSSGKPAANMINEWQRAAHELMTTEGARRRMRMEIERGGGSVEAVSDIEAYRRAREG